MADTLEWKSGTKSKTRKLPILPRFGFVIDWGGKRLTYKHSPILETLWNMVDHGVGLAGFLKAAREELREIPIVEKDNPYADGPAAKAASQSVAKKRATPKPSREAPKPPRKTKTTAKRKTATKKKAGRTRKKT